MKAAIIAGCVLFLVHCAAPGAHAGYFGNEKWTENDRYCVVEKLTAPSTPGSESGYLEWGEKNLLLMDLYQIPLIRTRGPIGAVRWT